MLDQNGGSLSSKLRQKWNMDTTMVFRGNDLGPRFSICQVTGGQMKGKWHFQCEFFANSENPKRFPRRDGSLFFSTSWMTTLGMGFPVSWLKMAMTGGWCFYMAWFFLKKYSEFCVVLGDDERPQKPTIKPTIKATRKPTIWGWSPDPSWISWRHWGVSQTSIHRDRLQRP